MSAEQSSDPLPFLQVDRAALPIAARLASAEGVSNQHALGSMVEFWQLCADPRELEEIVTRTPAGEEPVILLDERTLAMRWRIAFGKATDPALLTALGLVEPVGEQWRLRGGSRMISAVATRLQTREAAKAGGKASAEARKAKFGSAQPGSASVRTAPEPLPKRTPNRPRTDDRSAAEARPNQRSEDRGHIENLSTAAEETSGAAAREEAAKTSPPLELFNALQEFRVGRGLRREPEPSSTSLDGWWARVTRSRRVVDLSALRSYCADPYWASRGFPFSGFVAQWERHAPARMPIVDTPSTPEAMRWHEVLGQLLADGEAYAVRQLEQLKPRLEGETLIVEAADPYFGAWVYEHYLPAVLAKAPVVLRWPGWPERPQGAA